MNQHGLQNADQALQFLYQAYITPLPQPQAVETPLPSSPPVIPQLPVDLNPTQSPPIAYNLPPIVFPERPPPEPKVAAPSTFTGKSKDALEFILKCELVFEVQPRSYPSGSSARVAYATSLLGGDAWNWIRPYLDTSRTREPWTLDWTLFRERFLKDFGDSDEIVRGRRVE